MEEFRLGGCRFTKGGGDRYKEGIALSICKIRRDGLIPSPVAIVFSGLLVAGFAVGVATSQSSRTVERDASPEQLFHDTVNDTMGLIRSEVFAIDPDIAPVPGLAVDVQVPLVNEWVTLRLTPHSNRSDQYRVWKQVDDGSLVEVEPGMLRTYRGSIMGEPGSHVAAQLTEDGVHASITRADGDRYWMEPIARHVEGATETQHVVYRADDALCDGVCGVNAMQQHAKQIGGGALPLGADECKIAEIAIDADFQYYQFYGSSVSNVENQVNWIINTLNAQYEDQVGIVHEITEIIVRTSSASNPYTTNNAGNLLSQFRSHWNANHSNIPRSVAHLFTGRNLSGSTIGVAYLSRICQISWAYGLSQRLGNSSCMTDLTAHELGHNWSAQHCSCPSHTMNASLTCANQFSQTSINGIIAFRNTRTCLIDCPPPGPANNTCQGTIVVGLGQHTFTNIGATTNGPAEPQSCNLFGDDNIQSDVYFGHVAPCTGEMTISLCGSNFATKLAVYDLSCPSESGTVIACDTTSCPTNNRSELTIPVNQGQPFRIRVGGHNGAQGDGVLTITCDPAPVCTGDLNNDGVVDVSDLLLLLSEWGACNGCAADLDDSGFVDVSDLLLLLSAWGDC